MKDYFTNVLIAEFLQYTTFFYIWSSQLGI